MKCQQVDIQLHDRLNKKITLRILTDSVFVIQDIKELSHFKEKNKLVHNESCQLNMKLQMHTHTGEKNRTLFFLPI